jgi:TPR repeat protein
VVLAVLLALSLAQPTPDGASACLAYGEAVPGAPRPEGGEAGCAAALVEACNAGRPLACAAAARALEAGVGGVPDSEGAIALDTRACAAGVANACADLAALRRRLGDATGARQALEEACAIGAGRACAALADDARGGARAARLEERACDLGAAEGCVAALRSAAPARADALLARACRLGVEDACVAASAPALDARCARDDRESCLALGTLLQEGRFLPANGARAAALYARACDAALAAACVRLGILYRFGAGVGVDERRAGGLLERGCALGDADGCRLRDDPVRLAP